MSIYKRKRFDELIGCFLIPMHAMCQIRGPADFSNFDNYPHDMDIPPDELSGWDNDF